MVELDKILAKAVQKYTTHLTNHVTTYSLALTRPLACTFYLQEISEATMFFLQSYSTADT